MEKAKKLLKKVVKSSPGGMGLKILGTLSKQMKKNKRIKKNKKAVSARLKKGGSVKKMSRGGRVKK
jgi:hypothetical protein